MIHTESVLGPKVLHQSLASKCFFSQSNFKTKWPIISQAGPHPWNQVNCSSYLVVWLSSMKNQSNKQTTIIIYPQGYQKHPLPKSFSSHKTKGRGCCLSSFSLAYYPPFRFGVPLLLQISSGIYSFLIYLYENIGAEWNWILLSDLHVCLQGDGVIGRRG